MLTLDALYAVRALRRSPLFTAVVAITIALGIGASTALFSVANAVLLRPLPYKDPDRLVVMYMDLRARNNFAMPFSNRGAAKPNDRCELASHSKLKYARRPSSVSWPSRGRSLM